MDIHDILSAEEGQGNSIWHDERTGKFTSSEWWKLMREPKRVNPYASLSVDDLRQKIESRPHLNGKTDKDKWPTKPVLIELLINDDEPNKEIRFTEMGLTYINQKASECITLMPQEEILTVAMEWGKEQEKYGAHSFTRMFNIPLTEIGFIRHDSNSGGSPDRLIGEEGGIEVKCPIKHAIYLKYCLIKSAEQLKEEYDNIYWQIMSLLYFTKRKYWWFVAYYGIDSMNKKYEGQEIYLYRLKIEPNEADFLLIQKRLEKAVELRNEIIEQHDKTFGIAA